MDEYRHRSRIIASENASVDAKDQSDKDSSYLRDFLTKLKNSSELKASKQGSNHKKTASMISTQTSMSKRRELACYYLSQAKNKRSPQPHKPPTQASSKVSSSIQTRLEARLAGVIHAQSRDEANLTLPKEPGKSKRSSATNSLTHEATKAALDGDNQFSVQKSSRLGLRRRQQESGRHSMAC